MRHILRSHHDVVWRPVDAGEDVDVLSGEVAAVARPLNGAARPTEEWTDKQKKQIKKS